MTYKIVTAVFLALIILISSVYFVKPDVFDTDSVFYDQFYSGIKLETRLEYREVAQFPRTIGELALYGSTERGPEDEGISLDRECRFSDPEICSKMYRLQYRDSVGNAYFVNISKFKEGKDTAAIRSHLSTFAPSFEGDFFRFEKHEIGWISEERSAFIVVQQGVCRATATETDSCAYPNKIEAGSEVVTSFVAQFPPTRAESTIRKDSEKSNSAYPETEELASELDMDTFAELEAKPESDNPKRNFFVVGESQVQGKKYVKFAVGLWREDGENLEAFILYGDGDETNIAHWAPPLFTEEVQHIYKQPGVYTARLVLAQRALLTKDIIQSKKVATLPDLIEIKSITFKVDSSGKISITQ